MRGIVKRVLQYISVKTLILSLLAFGCLFLAGILSLCQLQLKQGLIEQDMAARWSKKKDAAQISAFFAQNQVENSTYFRNAGAELDQALVTASITLEEENQDARLWMDAISRQGKVSLVSERGKAEINAIGIKGDFFQFHPMSLVSGTYISQDSLMKDGIMIDEETAWNLFGSNDVAGMQVTLNGVPHVIVGVFERPEGRIHRAAGLEKAICFLGLDSLEQYGTAQGGYFYEIVMPNPIKGFALSTMNQVLKAETTEVKIVENSTRYELLSLIKVIQGFGTRSMSSESIIYPYWENIARGYEDIFALFLVIKTLLLLYPAVLFVTVMVKLYQRRTWSVGKAIHVMADKYYEMETKRRERKEKQSYQD